MERQKQLFNAQPDLTRIISVILAARPHPLGAAVAIADNILRPGGGGEPRDRGRVRCADGPSLEILGAEKWEGATWVLLPEEASAVTSGEQVRVELDSEYRQRRRRLHTAVHLAIRATQNHLGSIQVMDARIEEDAGSALVACRYWTPISDADVVAIDRAIRSEVLNPRPVSILTAKSIEHAKKSHGGLFRLSERYTLDGRIRLVCIESYDVNPCSGLHHPSTDIGPYELNMELDRDDLSRFAIRIVPTKVWTTWFGNE